MKQLILLRHAEAGFSQGSDFQRQLTIKGRENLNRMGGTLVNKLKTIDLMYCSSAQRTLETADLIGEFITIKENVITREIYQGDLEALIGILEKTSPTIDSCLLVGHNPTLSLLLTHISGENFLGLQPGMMAMIDLEISDWKMIGSNTGILKEIIQ